MTNRAELSRAARKLAPLLACMDHHKLMAYEDDEWIRLAQGKETSDDLLWARH
jgi:hypothetical protein